MAGRDLRQYGIELLVVARGGLGGEQIGSRPASSPTRRCSEVDLAVDQVVQDRHAVARLEQLHARVAPDVAAPARHHDVRRAQRRRHPAYHEQPKTHRRVTAVGGAAATEARRRARASLAARLRPNACSKSPPFFVEQETASKLSNASLVRAALARQFFKRRVPPVLAARVRTRHRPLRRPVREALAAGGAVAVRRRPRRPGRRRAASRRASSTARGSSARRRRAASHAEPSAAASQTPARAEDRGVVRGSRIGAARRRAPTATRRTRPR